LNTNPRQNKMDENTSIPSHRNPQPSFGSASASDVRLASINRVSASRAPRHASRSTRSSSNPRVFSFACEWLPPAPVPLEPRSDTSGGRGKGSPTPCGGGTNPAGGAVRTAGEMRAARMCASEERRAICIPCRMMDLVNDVGEVWFK